MLLGKRLRGFTEANVAIELASETFKEGTLVAGGNGEGNKLNQILIN